MGEITKRILSLLMVSGAQNEARALTMEELGAKINVPTGLVATEVNEMVADGYVQLIVSEGQPRVYLTGTGVITASSTYS